MRHTKKLWYGFEYTSRPRLTVHYQDKNKNVPGNLYIFRSLAYRDAWIERGKITKYGAQRVVVRWDEVRRYFWGLDLYHFLELMNSRTSSTCWTTRWKQQLDRNSARLQRKRGIC